MADTYSTYDAKARFSEIMRQVREGRSVYISYRGRTVAEIRPLDQDKAVSIEDRLAELEGRGIISPPSRRPLRLSTVAKRPGALKRFLSERNED